MPKLVITDSEGSRTLALDGELKAGRLAENEIQLKVPEASRHHCRFFDEKGTWFVEDMGSSNGTLVNGRKVSKFELQDGDLISVGAVTMRFLDSAPTAEERGAEPAGWGEDEISLETETFLVLGAPRTGEVVKIKGDRLTVGRKAKNDLVLAEASVSQDHAEIKKAGSEWVVRDLGSSNGTFVDGERVAEAKLASGSVVTFGEIAATFGIGNPAEFGPPEPVEVAVSARAETRMVDADSAFSDPTFSLSDVPEKKSPLASILAILLLLGLAGGLGWLYVNRGTLSGEGGKRGGGTVNTASNLVPQKFWSFEPHEVDASGEDQAGWHKDDPLDAASTGEVQEPSHFGDQAWSVARHGDKPGAATWVSLSGGTECDISVVPSSTFRLAGWVRPDPGSPVGGLAVKWIEPVAGDEARTIAREVVPFEAPANKWTEVSGLVQAPEGGNRAHVALVLAGSGEVIFDDVVLETSQAPPSRAVSVSDFRAWLGESGALRVFRFNRPVSDGMGLWRAVEGGFEQPWQTFVPKPGAAEGVSGTLREGGAALSVTLAAADKAFRVKWQLSGAAPGHAIMVPLPGSGDEINVTLLEGERAKRMRAAFKDASASGVIVGGQGDRMRIRFLDAEDKPFTAPVEVLVADGRPLLKVDRGDRTTVVFHCDLSFDAELSQARELTARAADAEGRKRFGEAMTLYEEVLARFPFDENTERQASAALEKLSNDGRARIKALSGRVDDAKFFRTARLEEPLLAEIQADLDRYKGTKLEPEITAKLEELKTERTKTAAEKHAAEGKKLFDRARDYAEMKQGRRELAIVLLEMMIERYPDTEWIQQAQDLLQKLKSQ